jgi:hypothetical protein
MNIHAFPVQPPFIQAMNNFVSHIVHPLALGPQPQIIFQQNINLPAMPFADLLAMIQNGTNNNLFGIFNAQVGDPGDYAMGGNLDNLLNQLFQNAQYRGTPPASKSTVEQLKRGKIESAENAGDCAVCKETFEIGTEYLEMPCVHIFHPDCILPWLEIHNSCPVCRMELKTDDAEYEARKTQNNTQPN